MANFTPPFATPNAATPVVGAVPGMAAPTAPTAPVDPVVPQMATQASAPVDEVDSDGKVKKPRKPRTTAPNRQLTPEDIAFVTQNVRTMSYVEMAEARGITKFQVNRILMDLKKSLRAAAKEKNDPAYSEKIEAYISAHLSRPDDARPGGAGRSGVVKNTLDDVVGSILNGL